VLAGEDLHGVERWTTGPAPLGRWLVRVHAYRLGSTLVDAGCPRDAPALAQAVGGDVERVLVTHAHEDHAGAGAHLADAGARVLAPQRALDRLADPPRLPAYRRWTWHELDPVDADPLDGPVTTPDGTFEAVPTRGHSRDHVALLEAERGWLFTGDAFQGPRTSLRFEERVDRIREAHERMRALEPERLFPGHGPVREDPDAALAEVLEALDELAERAHRLAEEGHSVPAVRRRLLGREGPLFYASGGEFSKEELVRAVLRELPPEPRPAPSAAEEVPG
jgi:glyoxylase-like metal-dependent hydrolase (beta-lactamase superfamily II)